MLTRIRVCSAQRVQNLAYALIQAGIQPGDRVAVIAPNRSVISSFHPYPCNSNRVLVSSPVIAGIRFPPCPAQSQF